MNLFDILGPVMVGPSSSHTAGAVRIGLMGRRLLGGTPRRAEILLHGSFALTGHGHGTDRALVAGLLGMAPDDARIPDSFRCADEAGMEFTFGTVSLRDAHPNTALLKLDDGSGQQVEFAAASLGGGRIRVESLDGQKVAFSGDLPTLIIQNRDQPGHVAEVTSLLSHRGINIATMQLFRDRRGGHAAMVIEMDQALDEAGLNWLRHLEGVYGAIFIEGSQADVI